MLRDRVITAIVLLLLVGGGILVLPEQGCAALFAVLVLLAAWEWSALSGLRNVLARMAFVATTLTLMLAAAWYGDLLSAKPQVVHVRDVVGLGCTWWAVALLWVKGYPASAVIWRSTAVRIVMGFLTLVPAWVAVVYLRIQLHGIALIFTLIALVASADIGAYFAGRAWGRRKLAPQVSPGKSWAGFWGGAAAATMLAVVLWSLLARDIYGLVLVLIIAITTVLASVLGDLLESMVKRQQGVKDSGTLLPGHGGVMDRLDSLTAAAPVFALCLILAG